MYAVRQWSVRHARLLERVYDLLEPVFIRYFHHVWKTIGYERVEQPIAFVERQIKSFLFDCQMCGRCVLSSTGMSCPMNCPKQLRNGPCGGVRDNGNCEVKPEMRCVWVDAEYGSRSMKAGNAINDIQIQIDHSLQGTSSWLRVVREKNEAPVSTKQ